MGFYEWTKRLDDRVVVPLDRKITPPWMRSPMTRVGMSTLIIFGGGFLMRVIFRHRIYAADWELITYAVVGLAGLLLLVLARHRDRTKND